MSHALQSDQPEIDTWLPTPAEWQHYVESGLQELGVTYEELAQQARDRNFQSAEAMHFWVIIGER